MKITAGSFGIALLTLFFTLGACAAVLTIVLLLVTGSALDIAWRANPQAHQGFSHMGRWALLLMTAVASACATAAVGLWRRTRWGLWTAVTVLAINLAGDTAHALIAHDHRTLIGLPVGVLMIAYLLAKHSVFLRR